MEGIGRKWKPVIIYLIRKGANRFGILDRGIEGIRRQMLTQQLRELKEDRRFCIERFILKCPQSGIQFHGLG